jgi:uncharacterized protein
MEPALDALLRASNPWIDRPAARREAVAAHLPPGLIPRRAARELAPLLDDDRRAHLLIGPRQCGKSTLLWSLLGEDRPLLFLNCEEPLVRSWCASPTLFVSEARGWLPEGGAVFLEEAQWLEEAGLFLKGLVDRRPGWSIFVTGSSSFHLLAKTRESLAGRATRHRLWPLSLEEVGEPAPDTPPAALPASRRAALDRLLVHGGYPEVWTSDRPEPLLHRLVEAFVVRDASDRFRIERIDAFRLLLELVAGQVGDLVNLAHLAEILGIASTTVSDYLSLLEETHVVVRVRPFSGGKRAELTSTPKLYFVDNGLRNALRGGFERLDRRADTGKLLESFVFTELHKRYPRPGDVRYWRTRNGAEVDFVLEPEPGRLLAIEVKAGAARRRIPRSARSFVDAYAPEELLIVHRGGVEEATLGTTRVRWVPAELLPEALPAPSDRVV